MSKAIELMEELTAADHLMAILDELEIAAMPKLPTSDIVQTITDFTKITDEQAKLLYKLILSSADKNNIPIIRSIIN